MEEIEDQAGFLAGLISCMPEEQRKKWLEIFGSNNQEILCTYQFVLFDVS